MSLHFIALLIIIFSLFITLKNLSFCLLTLYTYCIKWDLFFLYYRDCWHKISQNLLFNLIHFFIVIFLFYLAGATFRFLSNSLHCWSFARGHFLSATVGLSLKIIGTVNIYSRIPNLIIGTSLSDCFNPLSLNLWNSFG